LEGEAMWRQFYRIWSALSFLFTLITFAAAQDITGKIDLESNPSPVPSAAGGGIVYKSSLADCPSLNWQFVTSEGSLYFIGKHSFLLKKKGTENRTGHIFKSPRPLDDETYEFIVEGRDCRFVADIRQQVRNGEKWNYLTVERVAQHPNLSKYEKKLNGTKTLHFSPYDNFGNLFVGDGYMTPGFRFENAPPICLDMIGTFELDQDYLTFYFPVGLRPELNRFTILRSDIDNTQGRVYFSKGDCRYELTIHYAFLANGVWINRAVETKPRHLSFRIESIPK
jgi:hypothetical protein